MAWSNLTFVGCGILTALKMTQLQDNFLALAGGSAGAPPLAVNSLIAAGVGSFGTVHAASGFASPQVNSFGTVHAASGFVAGAAPAMPDANTLYKDNIPKAWICFKGTSPASVYNSFNIASLVRNGTGNYTVAFEQDFADAYYAVVTGLYYVPGNPQRGLLCYDARSKDVGACVMQSAYDTGTVADLTEGSVDFMGDQ